MHELDTLNEKLDLLLKKYVALQAENKSLKETIGKQQKETAALNEKLVRLEEKNAHAGLSTALADEDKDAMRKQLDSVIGEIDKILITLND